MSEAHVHEYAKGHRMNVRTLSRWYGRDRNCGQVPTSRGPRREAGLEELDERYAKGEIQRDEYLQKKRYLGG